MVSFDLYKDLNGKGGPFAYRMLPALLWKLCVFVLQPLHARYPGLHMPVFNEPFSSDEDWFVAGLTFFSMLGTLLVGRRLLRTIDRRWGFEWMVLGLGYAAYFDTILVLNRNLYYPYDLLALFLFSLLIYLAYRDRMVLFTVVLTVAMLNKETAVMAILFYFGLQYGRRPLGRLLLQCGGMGLLAVGVRLAQRSYIHSLCPTCHGMVQDQVSENLRQLLNPLFWLSVSSVFGYGYVAVLLFWRDIPKRIRVTTVLVFAGWIAAISVFGVVREIRIFSELSVLLLLAAALGVHGWLEKRQLNAIVAP